MRTRRLFHFGTLPTSAPRPALWISLGYDTRRVSGKYFLNITLFGRYLGRVYERHLYRRSSC